MASGLKTRAFSFQVLSAVVRSGPATPGAPCPVADKDAVAGSSGNTIVICGRNRSTGTLTPKPRFARLQGSFIADNGTFSSGPVAPTTSSRVLGNWSNVQITNMPGPGKTIEARVGSNRSRRSPWTTLTGYTALNSSPVVETSAGSTAYTEGDPGTVIDSTLTVSDADDATLSEARARISSGFNSASDELQFTDMLGIIGSYDSGTGMLTLTGSASVADYQTALRSITYHNSGDNPTTSRTVAFRANDDAGPGAEATKVISITPVNDAPTLTTTVADLSYTESDGAVVVDNGLTVADLDAVNLSGATIQITGNFSAAEDDLAFSDMLGITGSYNDTTGTLTLTGPATVASYQTALRSVTYENSSDDPSTATRTVSFQVDDGAAANNLSNVATRDVTVATVSDAPVVTASVGSTPYTEGDPPVPVDPGILVSDPDSSSLSSAIITIVNFESGDDLDFTDQSGISGFWDGLGTLSLAGSASVVDYQSALRSILYSTTSNNPSSSKVVAFTVIDDEALFSNTASKTIAITPVDEAPTAVDDSATVLEDASASAIDVLGNDTDPDSGPKTISSASDPANGTVVLTGGSSGAHTGLTYQPDPNYCNDPPGTSPDTFTYTLNGGSTATVSVTVTCVNDAPVVTTSGSDTAYTEGDPATTIDGSLTVTDVDDGNLESGQVRISAGFQSGDELAFVDMLGITGSYNGGTGVLTLSGTASVANYQTALRSIQFQTTNDGPGTSRTVEFKVNDGGSDSNLATKGIAITPVNDAPTLTTTIADLAYGEGDGAVAVDPGLTVADPDSANLQGATVAITANFIGSEDALAFTDMLGISGSYNGGTGVLTLSGTASVANYLTALRSVTYANSGSPASTATRTVSFQATDSDGAASNVATRDIAVSPPNDAPVVTTSGGDTAYTEGAAAAAIDAALTVTDAGDTDLEAATVSISAGFQAGDALGFTNQNGITGSYNSGTGVLTLTGTSSVANYQAALRSITFATSNDNPAASRTVSFVANDGDVDSNAATKGLVITAVNDAPTVTASGGNTAYTEGAAAVAIDSGLAVADVDDTNLEGATVSLSSNFQAGDLLGFTDQLGITGSYNSGTGVLTLSGSATVASYQTALRSVTFASGTNESPSATKTASIVVNDGDADSNLATKQLDITAVNDAPVNTVPASVTTDEDTTFNFTGGNTISVADPDAGSGALEIDLSVTNGTLTMTTIAGLTFTLGDGTSDAAMTFSGTLTNVNNALATLSFTPTLNFPGTDPSGTAVFSMTSDDQGNTGTGGALTDTDGFSITVNQVNDAPVGGIDDAETVPNVQLFYDSTPGAGVPATTKTVIGNGVLANDSDPVEGDNVAITGIVGCGDVTAPFDCATTGGGEVTLNADGSFTYRPDDGDTAADSFQYVLTDDGTPPASSNVTVNLTFVGNRIWFVKNNAVAGGLGRSHDPFDTLAEAESASAAGDTIFVYAGNGTNSGQDQLVSLKANQRLLGEGVGLTTNTTVNGTTDATLVAAGAQPLIGQTAAGGGVLMALGTTVSGLNIAGSSNAFDFTTTGAATSTNTVSNNTIRHAGQEGIDINLAAGTTGTVTFVITNNTWDTAGTHVGNGIDVDRDAGTLALTISGNSVLSTSGSGVVITGTPANTFIRGFASNSVHGNTPGEGINISGVTFDASADSATQQVDGDTLMIGSSGNPVGLAGLNITSSDGNLFFDDLDVFAGAGTALILTEGAGGLTFGVLAAAPENTGTSTLSTTFGAGINAVGPTISLLLADFDVTTGTYGIRLDGVGNQFRAPAGSTITKSAGADPAVSITNSAAPLVFTYNGTINVSAGAAGVVLSNNTGSTLNFGGTMTLSTGANAAFSATGGGTVVVAGSSNTLTTTTGTALNVANTTIGAGGLSFQSIDVDGTDAAPTNGIVLNNTGSTAGLTVTGTGTTDGSGGTIRDTSGDGISLVGTRSPSLSNMIVTSNLGNGIKGGDTTAGGVVTNATLANLTVSNNGNDSGTEDGILFLGLVGTATWSDLDVFGSARHNATVINNTGTLTSLTVSGSSIHENGGTGSNGLTFIADGTATMTVNVSTTNFNKNRVSAIVGQTASAGTLTLNVQGGTYTNNFNSIDFAHASSGNLTGTFNGATITNTNDCSGTVSPCGAQVNVFLGSAATSAGTLRATVTNNTINNGGSDVAPIVWLHTGTPAVGNVRALITGNTITNGANLGIEVSGGGCASGTCNATIDVTIESNTVTLASALAFAAIALSGATGPVDTVNFCVDIENNTATSGGADGIRVRHRQSSTVRLPGYGGSAFDATAVAAYLAGRNPDTVDTITAASSGTGAGFISGVCAVP